MTFQEIYEAARDISGDVTDANLVRLKRDVNIGNRRFNAAIGNYFTRRSKSTDLIENEQYYQLPPDCVRVTGVSFYLSTTRLLPLEQVRSEYQWTLLNSTQMRGNYLQYFFVRGADEIGLFPKPAQDVTSGLVIYYEPRGANLTQDDYTTGTITVTDGETTVTGAGTAFTAHMVGRTLKVTDDSSGYEYKITGYTSGTEIELEEPFSGFSGSGLSYKIGETPLFPDEYHDALIDYPLIRFYQLSKDKERAKDHQQRFDDAMLECKQRYASSSSSQVITDARYGYSYWKDNTITINGG